MILSKPYINKSEKSAKLLARWPLDVTQAKRKALAREPKSRNKPQKNLIKMPIKAPTEPESIDKEEVAMSIIKTTSKFYQPRLYDKAVNDPVYGHCWKKAIKEELQNLESY